MSLAPSRRVLATLTVAATLSLSLPGMAQALPSPDREEPRSFLQQISNAPAGWVQSFLTLWGASGDAGSSLDPDGHHAAGDNGSGLDPDGRT